jgi:hypothetical protein
VVAELLAARPLVLTPVAALVNNRPVSTRPVILTADWANTELATSAIMIAKIFFILFFLLKDSVLLQTQNNI